MQNILETIARIGPGRLIAIGITLMGLMGFFGFFVDKMMKPEMAILYTELEPSDAGAVMARLEAMGVAVEASPDGESVLAPKGELARLRMTLAQEGLPGGGAGGYELLDKANGLGVTSFAQQMTRLRAMEGELARSIRTLGPVTKARVHLVLPKRELFSREQQIPTASIIVAVRGAKLNPTQISAIQHLVASAVPKLDADRISIIDTRGNLLASGGAADAQQNGAASNGQIDARKVEVENRLSDAIEKLLERTVGPGRVRAEVSADLDFDRVTTNSEEFDPEGQVLRSTQTVTEQNENSDGNARDRVSVDNNLPEVEAGGANNGSGSASKSERTEEINNFEISKTIRTHIRESGLVRKLSVAVMVDSIEIKGEDGAVTLQDRSPEELATLESLAKSAVGYDAARGDVFQIASLAFVRPDELLDGAEGDVITFTKEDYFRIGQMAGLFIIALLAMLLVMRPAVNRALGITKIAPLPNDGALDPASQLEGPDGAEAGTMGTLPEPDTELDQAALENLNAANDEDPRRINLEGIQGSISPSTIEQIGALIDQHPEQSAAVLRSWMQRD